MKSISRRLFPMPALFATVLILMGANSQVVTSVSSSIVSTPTASIVNSVTGSIVSRPANSVVSKITGSIKSRSTGSVASGVTNSVSTNTSTGSMDKGSVTQSALSPHAEELARIIKFDRQVLLIVKEATNEHIRRLVGYDEEGYQIVAPGIAVPVPENKTYRTLETLRKKLAPLHYTPFIVEINPGLKVNKIGVIKGVDQYEILRIMHTDGEENDISNQDVIDKLKEWEKIATFDIIGADSDWVEIEFKTLPRDLMAFAREAHEFAPEIPGDGPRSIERLVKEIRKTHRLFLVLE